MRPSAPYTLNVVPRLTDLGQIGLPRDGFAVGVNGVGVGVGIGVGVDVGSEAR